MVAKAKEGPKKLLKEKILKAVVAQAQAKAEEVVQLKQSKREAAAAAMSVQSF